jgi:hypothetical protein
MASLMMFSFSAIFLIFVFVVPAGVPEPRREEVKPLITNTNR